MSLSPTVLAFAEKIQIALDHTLEDAKMRTAPDYRNVARAQAHLASEHMDLDATARLAATLLAR